jgi:hypothetical protein
VPPDSQPSRSDRPALLDEGERWVLRVVLNALLLAVIWAGLWAAADLVLHFGAPTAVILGLYSFGAYCLGRWTERREDTR